MKRIDRLILRSFIGPLVLTFVLAVFVLLMQFVWKYIDDMVGKGLDFKVIVELLLYASATFVPMALPIAVLFASIMTMGNFGEKYELVAMKAGGISVRRAMMPMAIVVLMLTGVAFYFANNVMPNAMLKYRMTLYDITRKKPAVNIRPGEYYKEIDGYVIHVGDKDRDGRTLHDVVIYDHTKGSCETILGEAFEGRRDKVVIATKVGGPAWEGPDGRGNGRKHVLLSVEKSLERLRTDYIDIYYYHFPDHKTGFEEMAETMDLLIKQGKIRYSSSKVDAEDAD